jgi:hypothetical protein
MSRLAGQRHSPLLHGRKRIRRIRFDREAFARERNGGRKQIGKRESPRAVFGVCEREPRNRAGHPDTERRLPRFCRIGLSVLVEKALARDRSGRNFAKIDARIGPGFAAR